MGKKKEKSTYEEMYSVYNEEEEKEEYAEEETEEEHIEEKREQETHAECTEKEGDRVHRVAGKLERLRLGASIVQEAKQRVRSAEIETKKKETGYRSPICCILGHVDTGKTKILDRIRETEVQLAEAGGITQQIGATYIPMAELQKKYKIESEHLPGLLVIDTPGHEAFSNLRTRGSSMCNIVVLVIDVMHGLELQTRESIEILRRRKTPFVIALNKIDRIKNWQSAEGPYSGKKQDKSAQTELKQRYEKIALELSVEGLNTALFTQNPDTRSYISVVPTSAVTGEGVCDLLRVVVGLVESKMLKKVKFEERVECMVLEARAEEGKAATVDVILSNGMLREGDRIVLCTQSGAVDTVIKKLLTPHPMKETRVKTKYMENKEVRAAAGVRIVAAKLEGALAGSKVYVTKESEIERTKKEIEKQMQETIQSLVTRKEHTSTGEHGTGYSKEKSKEKKGTKSTVKLNMKKIAAQQKTAVCSEERDRSTVEHRGGSLFDTVGEDGVHAQASTLGSLEALITILKGENIAVRTVSVGHISKKDIIKASTIQEKHPEYAVMLCFDVKPTAEMQAVAQELQVKIITAEIIYHLTEKYKKHMEEYWEKTAETLKEKVVFPCILSILPNCVFTKRSPLVLGVKVEEGILRIGTPLVVMREDVVTPIGKVTSIMEDTKQSPRSDKIPQGGRASIKIEVGTVAQPVIVGRKLFETDKIYSRLTRESIDILKESFKDALTKEEWLAVIKIKESFDVVLCHKNAVLPCIATKESAGYDLFAPTSGVVEPGQRKKIDLGIKMKIPAGHYGQMSGRSGLAVKHGIMLMGGVIDADYRDEVAAIVYNTGTEPYRYSEGDRIAQIVIIRTYTEEAKAVEKLVDTERVGGFGSTGK